MAVQITEYDREVWRLMLVLTSAVTFVIAVLCITITAAAFLIWLPISWLFGAGMTWGWGKYRGKY